LPAGLPLPRMFRPFGPYPQQHPMDQSLPQELVKQVGGSFRLTALLQKRVRELVRGQRPLFETRERNYIKIASEELKRGLIELVADEEQTGPTKIEI
jgi:DNA-directed RNA polymerase subunit K/omega